jgi:aryl-alcohol dehydrogenase-like predicted oxidoreductase
MALDARKSGQVNIGDLIVNRLGFGAMRITGSGIWGEPADHDGAIAVLRRAAELGVDFFDTADAYGPEVSENLICEALYPYDGLVIATKGGLTRQGPGIWTPDGSPQHLRQALEGSLERLKLKTIDLYQFHRPDPKVLFEDSIRALVELQEESKIRHIGLSNVTVDQIKAAQSMTDIVSVQNRYNAGASTASEEVLKYCQSQGIAFIPYFPIGGDGTSLDMLEGAAKKHNVTVRQIALAWLLAHSPVMLPIPGTSSIEHLEENIAAVDIKLDDEDLAELG